MTKKCEFCAAFEKEQQICRMNGAKKKATDFCSSWLSEAPVCEMCGRNFSPPRNYVNTNTEYETFMIICDNCFNRLGKCETCGNNSYCDFKENTDCKLPPFIVKRTQQGNMIVQHQIPNTARIEETCKKNCKCYNKEQNCCSRSCFGMCSSYEIKIKKEEENDS
jgi:hypothetical protein